MLRTTKPLAQRLAFLFACWALSPASQIISKAQDATPALRRIALSDSTRRVIFDSSAFNGPSTPLPEWDNGYLVSREIETFQPGVPNVRLYNTSGEKVREAAIWFPGSQRVLIYAAVATSDGRIIAGGNAEKLGETSNPFIAITDSTGKVTDVIATKGFAPANICQAPDGTVWSFGGTYYDYSPEPKPGNTLRHFDFHKGEIGSYLLRSTFPKSPGPENLAYIRCLPNEVVAYSSKAQRLIEMKYDGDAPHVYHANAPPGMKLGGFAVTGSKKVYGHFFRAGNNGLYSLSFDELANMVNWLPVEGTSGAYTKPGAITALWGSDGDNLLVNRAEDGAGANAIYWVTPSDNK